MRSVIGLVAAVLLAACGVSNAGNVSTIAVVAGENFWGSIAGQLGDSKVSVVSIVTDPNADPHEYESSTADARAFADARLVILDGAGYDDWGQKLLDANPSSGRQVMNVAELLGKKQGDNPHFWYSPDYVARVADKITAEYKSIDPTDASYFDQQRSHLTTALQPYLTEIANIKQHFGNTPVGSTESIFVYMADASGLKLISPPEFMEAVAEGNDPPAPSVVEFQDQVSANEIKVLVYNVQTVTAVTTNIKDLAASHHIPKVGVSETMQPPSGVTFQDWQLKQLQTLEQALKASA
ncbi:MAG TPA: zinc ABC transporter substrate-binding protein [Candidatus Dormibacteraeota bacterium]|nr:zinc ABC transporter substrate-binding protein [Candidatus Dormibacteraeota bacterium]